jgi:hypothetical protein
MAEYADSTGYPSEEVMCCILGGHRRIGVQLAKGNGDSCRGEMDTRLANMDQIIKNTNKILTKPGRNSINVETQALEKMRHKINVRIHPWFVFENVLALLNSLKRTEGCMKITSCSKRGHKPILSIFENELAVVMDSIEEILPIFLKKFWQENLVQRRKHFVIE